MSGSGLFLGICLLAVLADGPAHPVPAVETEPCRFTLERGMPAAEAGDETWVLTCHRGQIQTVSASHTVSLRVTVPGPALLAD
jgi:uncharacterized Zn-binding protein involved in type VI secretion